MVKVATQCCICVENIEETHKLDPCYLHITANAMDEGDDHLQQGFFCHYTCIKGAMDYDGYLNLEDQDLEEE